MSSRYGDVVAQAKIVVIIHCYLRNTLYMRAKYDYYDNMVMFLAYDIIVMWYILWFQCTRSAVDPWTGSGRKRRSWVDHCFCGPSRDAWGISRRVPMIGNRKMAGSRSIGEIVNRVSLCPITGSSSRWGEIEYGFGGDWEAEMADLHAIRWWKSNSSFGFIQNYDSLEI